LDKQPDKIIRKISLRLAKYSGTQIPYWLSIAIVDLLEWIEDAIAVAEEDKQAQGGD
jgi:hypothetical protein